MALKLKGVEYEYVEEDLKNKSPDLLKYNPIHKKVPLLLHNGKPILESLVILEYIDETWPGPAILPSDPYDRAMARFWAKFLDEKCWPAMRRACLSRGEEQEKANEEANEVVMFLENELKGNKLFWGDTIGLVDIAANLIGHWYGIFEEFNGIMQPPLITKDKFPNLCEWVDKYTNRSFVKENLPPKDKLAQLYMDRIQAAKAAAQ
ncbi:hypothetical protein RD792_014028 [Penstemon davidsonii]|uniref:glutathione transferase n=1 Tax=Penstemon davidsonii TaxID=160366 RepID=A0ABR0CN68_9LAMI|nr:hypothetical protein RD792_014028 [Penstemon davidsonii]